MNKRISSTADTRKKKVGTFIACVLALSVITTGVVFAIQTNSATSPSPEPSRFVGLGFTNYLDLTDALNEIGLTFLHIHPFPDFGSHNSPVDGIVRWCSQTPWIGRLSPDTPILLVTKADMDLILEVLRIATVQGIGGVTWSDYLDEAIQASAFYDYFWVSWREIASPSRQAQLIHLATTNSFTELYEMHFRNRPCLLLEFHDLGFFLEVSVDDVKSMNCR